MSDCLENLKRLAEDERIEQWALSVGVLLTVIENSEFRVLDWEIVCDGCGDAKVKHCRVEVMFVEWDGTAGLIAARDLFAYFEGRGLGNPLSRYPLTLQRLATHAHQIREELRERGFPLSSDKIDTTPPTRVKRRRWWWPW